MTAQYIDKIIYGLSYGLTVFPVAPSCDTFSMLSVVQDTRRKAGDQCILLSSKPGKSRQHFTPCTDRSIAAVVRCDPDIILVDRPHFCHMAALTRCSLSGYMVLCLVQQNLLPLCYSSLPTYLHGNIRVVGKQEKSRSL